jgi:tetratricopeptide (TPR) repeat protein
MSAALLVASLLCAGPGTELNAKGEALVKQGQYREALSLFRKAAEADPRLAAAFYNQALAMAGLRRAPGQRVQPSKKDVLDAVEQAIALDPKMRARAEQDFSSVRTTFRGQRLIGRTLEKDSAAILQAIAWHSRAAETLTFGADGAVRYVRDLVPRPGRWTVQGRQVTVTIGKTYQGQIDDEGVLTLEGLGRFFDW